MRSVLHKVLVALLLVTAAAQGLWAQGKKAPKPAKDRDRVHLISAQSAQLIEKDGESFRKVVGPAKFLHNDTYLLCDTALWNINTNIIDATGHVRIIQDRTKLSSATLQYIVDEDMARFRGDLVQLEDNDKNVLRTRYLDYNTKDSVAIFQDGGAMRDKDGQIIESLYGTYDSKAHLFVFNDQVNMFMDTTFIKTSRLEYRSDLSTAYFGYSTDMWQDDKMLSANDGWYDRTQELFMFRRQVHLLTRDRETWSDSLYYYRALNNVDMRGKVEVMDTTRNVYALAGRLVYVDSLSQAQLMRDPAIMSVIEEEGVRPDSLYLGADTLLYRAVKRCDIPDPWIRDADKRQRDISGDPIMEYRRKAAEAAAKAAEEAMKNDPNRRPDPPAKKAGTPAKKPGPTTKKVTSAAPAKPTPPPPVDSVPPPPPDTLLPPPPVDTLLPPRDTLLPPPVDSLLPPRDTLLPPRGPLLPPPDSLPAMKSDSLPAMKSDSLSAMKSDSLSVILSASEESHTPPPADTLTTPPADTVAVEEPPKDTTKVTFMWGIHNVKLFRRTMQMAADSLAYGDLDSLIRLYKDPVVYNEGDRQYVADSIYMVVRNKRVEKAHLLSNAFITIQEDPVSYDQVSGTEMVAYFDSTSVLTRFDALGGTTSIFFLEEEGALATVNKVEAKMLYVTFADGEIERMYYYDNPKNDGYPTVQLPGEERTLKGFRWEPERRPKSPEDVTPLKPRASQRTEYLARPHTEFKQTNIYFPGYINKVYRDIAIRDSLHVARDAAWQRLQDSLAHVQPDSLAFAADSLSAVVDSLSAPRDSLTVPAPLDSLKVPADSLTVSAADSLGTQAPKEPTPEEIKAQQKAEKERIKAAKAAEKARKKAEKQKALEAKWAEEDRIYAEKQAAKAQRKLEKERARKRKMLERLDRKSRREQRILEKYLEQERAKALKKKTKQITKL